MTRSGSRLVAIAVVSTIALLHLAVVVSPSRADTTSDPNDSGGRLDLHRLAIAKDQASAPFTITLTTWQTWPNRLLRLSSANRLAVDLDLDGDGARDLTLRVVRAGGHLVAQVRRLGDVIEELATVRPGPRQVSFTVPVGSQADPTGPVRAIARSRLRGATCHPCTDRTPDQQWFEIEPTGAGEFTCTEVIGFSQTRQWFLGAPDFEQIVGTDGWQLLWESGAGVDHWADPNYRGWSNAVDSPCQSGSDDPDRILLTISMQEFQDDVDVWEQNILAAIDTIRDKFPDLEEIVLQPVVGGPDDGLCEFNGAPVRASSNHPVIDAAIAAVVGGDVIAGDSPEVRACDDYADATGHLLGSAQGPIGANIAAFYV